MKLFTLTATAAIMLSLGISSAEAHPRLWPHSHAARVVVEKQVVVKPAPCSHGGCARTSWCNV
jgi:hypothetical protein